MRTTCTVRGLFIFAIACFTGQVHADCSSESFQHTVAPGSSPSSVLISDGSSSGNSAFTVPAGKRLAIEHVSVLGFVPVNSGQGIFASINTQVAGKKANHFLPAPAKAGAWSATSQTPPFDALLISQPIRVYADAGTKVGFGVSRTGSAAGQVSVYYTVSGRLLGPCAE